jgi:hypothetical protein
MREISILSAILRDAHANPDARQELSNRLRSLRIGDFQRWSTF